MKTCREIYLEKFSYYEKLNIDTFSILLSDYPKIPFLFQNQDFSTKYSFRN